MSSHGAPLGWWPGPDGRDRAQGRQQALVGASQRVPTAAPGLEADLKAQGAAPACLSLAIVVLVLQPAWSVQIRLKASTQDLS